jgi:hypothetical protein
MVRLLVRDFIFWFQVRLNHADVAGARLGEPNQVVSRSCARAAPGGGKAVGQSSGCGPVSLLSGQILMNRDSAILAGSSEK